MFNVRLDKLHPAQWFVGTPINDDLPRGIDHLQVTDGTSPSSCFILVPDSNHLNISSNQCDSQVFP
jgi:hypothetical protein